MTEQKNKAMNKSNIIMYTTEDGLTKVEATFDQDTVWLSLDDMARLFQRDKSTISRHLKNIFSEGELNRNSVVALFATTASDGKTYQVDYYNLDVIISVGYRVKSLRGTQFRIWAMGILKEYMRKGFAMDDERLKRLGGGNYFDELLARIRDIRSSEKVFWRKVLEIYAITVVIPFNRINNQVEGEGNKEGNKTLNPTQIKVLAEIRNNPNITKKQLEVCVGVGKTAIDKSITKLREMGFIQRIGSNKTGWELLK